MNKNLWDPKDNLKKKSNLYKFENFLSKKLNYKISKNFSELLKWSIKNKREFWSSIWSFCKVKGHNSNKFIFKKELIKNKFFKN